MLAAQRRAFIVQLARSNGAVRVAELVQTLGVSDVTVRRDLDVLVREGRLEKVHGGAVPAVPRPAARGEQRREGAPVGVLLPGSSYYFNRVLVGMRRAAAGAPVRLLLAVSDYRAERERDLVAELLASGARALLAAPGADSAWLAELGVPVVLVERRAPEQVAHRLSWVRTAHESGAARAVALLREAGHERIALFCRGDTPTAASVRAGWEHGLRACGVEPDPALHLSGTEVPGWPHWDRTQVRSLADRLLGAGATALLCHSDEDALALLQNGLAAELPVPARLSVIAYDDEFSALTRPALTAVSPPKESVGALAVRTALDLLDDDLAPVRHIDCEPLLIPRQSTAAPPGD